MKFPASPASIHCFHFACALAPLVLAPLTRVAANPELRDVVAAKFAAEYPSLEAIYKNLHANPELSFMETKTAAIVARELRALGIEVTEKVGNTGVVGVLKNGAGPTVLIRRRCTRAGTTCTSPVSSARRAPSSR
jgi:hippurate hydrolase